VAVGQQPNDEAFDQITLADDDFADFVEKRARCTCSFSALIPVFIIKS